MSDFQLAKLWLAGSLGMSKDALHICVGMAVYLLAAALLRRPLRDWRPLAAVFLAALAGELWDLVETMRAGETVHWDRSGHDIWLTALWPAVLFALARWTRLMKR